MQQISIESLDAIGYILPKLIAFCYRACTSFRLAFQTLTPAGSTADQFMLPSKHNYIESPQSILKRRLPRPRLVGVAACIALSFQVGGAYAQSLPDILVNHDGLINGVQDTSGPAGGTFTYRAKVKLNAGDDATGVVLTEVLPVGAIFISRSSTPSGINCTPTVTSGTVLTNANNTFNCNVGSLTSADGFKWVDFNVVLPSASSTWTATASAALPAPNGTNDGDGGLNNVNLSRNFTANDATDLGIVLTANAPAGGVNNGDPYEYTLRVTNYGPTSLPPGGFARVTFQAPSGAPITSNASLGGGGWTCNPASGPVAANGTITCDFVNPTTGSYAAGAVLPELTIPVQSQMGGPIGAAASVEGYQDASTKMADGRTTNNTSSVIVQSTGADYTDVSLTKTVTPARLDSARTNTVTYTLRARRGDGALAPEQIVVSDTLPAGVTFAAFGANDARWSCAEAGGTITCQWNAAGGVYTGANNTNFPDINFTATVPGQPSGNTVTNEAVVAVKAGTEPNTANNKGSATATFSNTAQLSLVKAGPARPVRKGVPFRYTLTVKNDGPMPIAAGAPIQLTDTPSANLRLLSVNADSSANWTCSAPPSGVAGAPATCENSSALAVGDTLTLVLDAQVDTLTGDYATFGNSASTGIVPGRDGESVSGNATVTVSEQAGDLLVAKSVLAAPANPKSGDEITYRISVTNKASSTQTAQGIKLTDVLSNLVIPDDGAVGSNVGGGFVSAVVVDPGALPAYPAGAGYAAGTTTVTCPAPTGGATSRNRTLTCDVDFLAVDATVSVDVTIKPRITTATPAAQTEMQYRNTASAFSPFINDPTPADNEAFADIQMTSLVDLTVDKQVSPTTQVAAGQPAAYTVTVKNQGPSSAQTVKMVDTLPANAIMVGEPVVPSGGVCEHSLGSPMSGKQGGRMTCTWTTALASQNQYVVTYRARSVGGNPAPGATMDNVVVVSTDTEEIRTDNNTANATIALKPAELDVQIQMSHSDDGLVLGGTTEYTITIKNDNSSSSYATNVKMSDLFPATGSTATFSYQGGLSVTGTGTAKAGYVSGVGGVSPTMCATVPASNATTGPLECTIPLMAPGDTVTIKFTMKAESLPTGAKTGTVFHQASVKPDETEFMPGYDALANNTTSDRTSTSATSNAVDLGVNKQGPAGVFKAGDTITYTITVTNYGQTAPSPAGTMTDTLPRGLEFVSGSAGCTGVVGASDPVVCSVPGMARGASTVFTVVAKIANPFNGTYPLVNKARVTVAGDTNPDNDESSFETKIPPPNSVSGIPTLSEWGLLILSLLLGAFAFRQSRVASPR